MTEHVDRQTLEALIQRWRELQEVPSMDPGAIFAFGLCADELAAVVGASPPEILEQVQSMMLRPVPPTVATDDAFRDIYCQGYRHALSDVLKLRAGSASRGRLQVSDPDASRVSQIREQPPQHIIDLAVEVSGYSPCRSKRGVVIYSGEDMLTHGYNYKPRGFDCSQNDACKATCRREAVHAEQQALLLAGRKAEGADMLHVKTVNGALVPSGPPSCVECSKLARACGIAGVWLYHETGWRRYPIIEFHTLSLLAVDVVDTLTQQVERLQQAVRAMDLDLASNIHLQTRYMERAEQAEAEVARLRGELTRVYQLYSEAVAALGEEHSGATE